MAKPRETALFRAVALPARILEGVESDEALAAILDSAIELTEAERGFLVTVDEEDQVAVKVARFFGRRGVPEDERAFSTTLVRRALDEGRTLHLTHAGRDPKSAGSRSVKLLAVRSALVVPLLPRGQRFGALVIEDRRREAAFDEEHVRLVEIVAANAALALETKRASEELAARNAEIERLNARLAIRLDTAETEVARLERERWRGKNASRLRRRFPQLVGASPALLVLLLDVERAAENDLTVLIQGESGTGKELIAQAIQKESPRAAKPFVATNMTELPGELLESLLFGHVKGAFTGAHEDRLGLVREAEGGTLFLDEIGDLPLALQKKLLRFLQEKTIRPLGTTEEVRVDVRVIAATHKDLEAMVKAGTFRADLYYRLAKLRVEVPPLRARRGDVALLARHFVARGLPGAKGRQRSLSAEALAQLEEHDWRGNVRELENAVSNALTLSRGPTIERAHFKLARIDRAQGLRALEREEILRVVGKGLGLNSAAEELGVGRTTLWRKLKAMGIRV